MLKYTKKVIPFLFSSYEVFRSWKNLYLDIESGRYWSLGHNHKQNYVGTARGTYFFNISSYVSNYSVVNTTNIIIHTKTLRWLL